MHTKTGSSEFVAAFGRGGFSPAQWTIPTCGLLSDMWSGIRSEPRWWPGLKTIPGAAPPPTAECAAIPCSLRYRSPGRRRSRIGQSGWPRRMMRRCSRRFGSTPEPAGLLAAKGLSLSWSRGSVAEWVPCRSADPQKEDSRNRKHKAHLCSSNRETQGVRVCDSRAPSMSPFSR